MGTNIHFLDRSNAAPGAGRLAYHALAATQAGRRLPALMFLGGFRSDMMGTKALFLLDKCRKRGQALIRFDYTGHGQSGGAFEEGSIGLWADDARDILEHICPRGPVILIGSSMGGWISLLLARRYPDRVRGVIGIAAAPDFTKTFPVEVMDDAQKRAWFDTGRVTLTDGAGASYTLTRALVEDGAKHYLLDAPLPLKMPVCLLQGMKDADVPWQTAYRIKKAIESGGGGAAVIPVADGDHRLSRPQDLALLDRQVCLMNGA